MMMLVVNCCTVRTLQNRYPFEALAAFNGDLAQGVWTLE
jgi:hypothetical protein